MKEIHLSKGGGRTRTVYSPDKQERRKLLRILPVLQRAERALALKLGTSDVAHGFIVGRNPVTCALAHRGMDATISCDLEGWFDSVTKDQIGAALVEAGEDGGLAAKVCHLGAPRQGLATSPSAANLVACKMDRAILDALSELPCRWVYTRYADDLMVSLAEYLPLSEAVVLTALRCAAQSMGWKLAEQKTRVQHASQGRRVMVGVSVAEDVRAPREMRRKLRAARHQRKTPQANGLAEWCAMRLPRAARPARQMVGVSSGGCAQSAGRKARPRDESVVSIGCRRLILNPPTEEE